MLSLLVFCLHALVIHSYVLESDVKNGARPDRHWMFYIEEESGRMVSVVTNPLKGTLVDCYVSGDRTLISTIMQTVPEANVTFVDKGTMEEISGICTYAKQNGHLHEEDGEEVWQEFGFYSGFFIYPGTKWCGAGNISSGYDDLGEEVEADRCCRDHDHCEDYISGHESKYGLDNNSPFTKSHCDCDDKFYRCLVKADTRASNRIGQIFFNFIQMECFRKDHPVTGCKRYIGRFRRRCQEYEYDRSGEKIWQMFDAKHYKAGSDEDNEIEDKYKDDLFEFMLRKANGDKRYFSVVNKVS